MYYKEAIHILLQEELLKTIETMIQKSQNNHSQSRDIASVITDISNDKFEVQIYNDIYWVKNGVGITLNVGDPVWIHIPNGNMNEMFIMAKK